MGSQQHQHAAWRAAVAVKCLKFEHLHRCQLLCALRPSTSFGQAEQRRAVSLQPGEPLAFNPTFSDFQPCSVIAS